MIVRVFDHMEDCTASEVERMLPLVSDERREQTLRYKHLLGQYCCLKSWLLLDEIIRNSTRPAQNLHKSTIGNRKWEYNEHGKPFLPGGPCFSISHCKEGIAVAVDEQPIGIDIEAIRPADSDLIARVMNMEEQALIRSAEVPARMFTRFWTQKEAIVKAQGVGIYSFEQLQHILESPDFQVETVENEKYIYSIAYGKLHCISA